MSREKLFKTIIFDSTIIYGVPVRNEFGAPSEDVYCKKEVVEVVLVETPSGTKVNAYSK